MSGTSLDGIDLVYVSFSKNKNWSFEILASNTYEYNRDWKIKLASATEIDPADLKKLDFDYTHFLGGMILDFIAQNNIKAWDAVASHGHTIFHQPEKGLTLQIGNLSSLAEQLGGPVICDFRVPRMSLWEVKALPWSPWVTFMLFNHHRSLSQSGGFFQHLSVFQNQASIWPMTFVPSIPCLTFWPIGSICPMTRRGKVARQWKNHPLALFEHSGKDFAFYVQRTAQISGDRVGSGMLIL